MFSALQRQEIQLFLGLLFPWEDEHVDLWKSVSWSFTGRDGNPGMANFAAQSFDDLMRLIETRAKRRGADVYVCLGTQRTASAEAMSTDGFPKAVRQYKNLVNYKSIALDIDVKEGGYATTEDAFAALDDFVAKAGLPKPTMEVFSGSGGLHVYWCTAHPMPFANWLPLAKALQAAALHYKLKFDPQVTINPAGILRVPNTYNYKPTPAAMVRLYRDPNHDFPQYDYQQLVGALSNYVDNSPGVSQAASDNKLNKNFIDNVSEAVPPVPIEDVAVNCPAIDDILERGGKDDAEPLWNLALLAASFTSDPYGAAHALSDGDRRYKRADTEKKLLEKINARAANPDLGWPKCDAFSKLHSACATCPLFAQQKSPFNFVTKSTTQQQQSTAAAHNFTAANDPLMPLGYWRNKLGHVMTTLYSKNGSPYVAEIINYPLINGGLDPTDGTLLYEVTIGGVDRKRDINVSSNMQPIAAAAAMSKGHGGVYVHPKNHAAVRDFLVAWVSHLQTIKRDSNQSSYGWSTDGAAFAFDDKIYHANTVETVHRGKHHDASFSVSGKLKPWQDAMQLVYGNMPLETVVASAFAAPLIELIGTSSLVMSVYSHLSGIGKTTAMMLAQSVWGNPRSGMSTLADTTNSMMKKISDLKSLPVYWDELRTKDQLEKVIDLVFQVTQGKSKSRLTKEIVQADAPTFTTMFIVASNQGIADTVYSQTESTEAGGLRLFEIEAQPLKTTLSSYEANQLLIPLQTNFGVAGATYASLIASQKPAIITALKAVSADLQQRHKLKTKERFWGMTMATLLVGATMANYSGLTNFDLPGLTAYLDAMLTSQRKEMQDQEYATLLASQDVAGLLQEMVSELRGKSVLATETIPYVQAGRPVPLRMVETGIDPTRLGDVWIQLGANDGRIRVRLRPFKDWLRKRGLNVGTIKKLLKDRYIVTQSRQSIGAGVAGFDAASIERSACLDLTPLPSASPAPSPGSDAPN